MPLGVDVVKSAMFNVYLLLSSKYQHFQYPYGGNIGHPTLVMTDYYWIMKQIYFSVTGMNRDHSPTDKLPDMNSVSCAQLATTYPAWFSNLDTGRLDGKYYEFIFKFIVETALAMHYSGKWVKNGLVPLTLLFIAGEFSRNAGVADCSAVARFGVSCNGTIPFASFVNQLPISKLDITFAPLSEI